ncbi:hypothetical protein ACFX2I_014227 [Malus domestica]
MEDRKPEWIHSQIYVVPRPPGLCINIWRRLWESTRKVMSCHQSPIRALTRSLMVALHPAAVAQATTVKARPARPVLAPQARPNRNLLFTVGQGILFPAHRRLPQPHRFPLQIRPLGIGLPELLRPRDRHVPPAASSTPTSSMTSSPSETLLFGGVSPGTRRPSSTFEAPMTNPAKRWYLSLVFDPEGMPTRFSTRKECPHGYSDHPEQLRRRTKAHEPKTAPTRQSKVCPVLHNYSATRRYYRQPGDQKYAQYSKIIRQPAAITTNQVMKCITRTLISFVN